MGGVLGGLAGGAACALSGANTTECALLVIGGAAAGYAVATYIDEKDKKAYQAASYEVLEKGQATSSHTSTETGNVVKISKVADGQYTNSQGEACNRITVEYQGTPRQENYCKKPSGVWTLV